MKTVIINASPRKNWNTAQLLQSAEKGAKAAGMETEYIDLYDLTFSGCRSCLACKIKDGERCKCFWKDDLSPVLDKILDADNVIIGSPIYLGETTASFRALMERLLFCCLSYNGDSPYLQKKINTGLIYTMNASAEFYESTFKPKYQLTESLFKGILNGEVRTYASCDTYQVCDYSKFDMAVFDPEKKKAHREKQFPIDLENAYQMGYELGK